MIKEAIKKVVEKQNLPEQEMMAVMAEIMEGRATDAQIAAFITALRMKGETIDEITGAAKVMRGKALSVPLTKKYDLVDIVGTGGDNANTFNVSTASAFTVCGAGLCVAKHGNRSVSSRCGSADVMEKLGVNIDISPEAVGRCIETIGIGFLFAPRFHLAMKYAVPARKETGIRTIFNILGPLTNPSDAESLLIGVYDETLTELFAAVLKHMGRKRVLVVHGDDGLDEISINALTRVSELKDGNIINYIIDPKEYGFSPAGAGAVQGGTSEENAEIIVDILRGGKGPERDIVLINSGAAIMASGKAADLHDGIRLASQAIDSGHALQKLNALRDMTGKLA